MPFLIIDGIELPDVPPCDFGDISGRFEKEPQLPKLTDKQIMDILLNTDIMDL